METDVLFTEHNLDTKTNNGSLLKNASTKSIILAPFNSTVSDMDDEEEKVEEHNNFDKTEDKLKGWPSEVKNLIVHKKVIKFGPKCRDLDR